MRIVTDETASAGGKLKVPENGRIFNMNNEHLRVSGRAIDQMTDVPSAKRLLIFWVPKQFSRWKRVSWAVCFGRLWFQWTPDGCGDNGLKLRKMNPLGEDLLNDVEVKALYYELIMEVATKFPNESRHETARRYIHERENMKWASCAASCDKEV